MAQSPSAVAFDFDRKAVRIVSPIRMVQVRGSIVATEDCKSTTEAENVELNCVLRAFVAARNRCRAALSLMIVWFDGGWSD